MSKKLKALIAKHRGFFKFSAGILNRIPFRNKLRAKGCKLNMGVSFLKGVKIINRGRNNTVTIGDLTRLKGCKIYINGNNNKITIGDICSLFGVCLYIEDDNNDISIGRHTTINENTQLSAIEGTKISIGDDCLFSSDIHFRTGDSHSIVDLNGNRINESKDIVIGNHVWFGTKVVCLKGVCVANDSVIAATTLLTKQFDEGNVIIGGVPGKIMKREISWKDERIPVVK